MNKERLNLLENYIKSGVSPLLVQTIPSNSFNNSVMKIQIFVLHFGIKNY